MQLPSAAFLFRHTADTVRRFPFETVFAFMGTCSAVGLADGSVYGILSNDWYIRLLMMALIGLPLSLATSLYMQNAALPRNTQFLFRGLAAAIAFAFLFILKPEVYPQDIIHFALIYLALHLLVSFAGFTNSSSTIAFWHFNKELFVRLLTGLLYSTALAGGLTAAFIAVNSLFGLDLNFNNLYKLWIITFGLFNTLFVLAGIATERPQNEVLYPKGLKLFSQYVLIPLATLYLAILLTYELKILVQWQLPKGMVSALILGYTGVGLLALLLVYPIRDQEGNGWIKVYSRYFYLFLLPLIILLILAVTKRISSYGITQYRYFLIALAVWLIFLIVYFLAVKNTTIKAIPVSLFMVIVLISYGPQSATSVSLRSQRSVLLALFTREKAVRKNKLQPVNEQKIRPYNAFRMASTLNYILSHYDFEAMQPLLSFNLAHKEDSLLQNLKNSGNYIPGTDGFRWIKTAWVQNYLGLGGYEYHQYETEDQLENNIFSNYYITCEETVSPVKGYDFMLIKEAFTDTTKTGLMDGRIVKQYESFEHDTISLNIGQTKFTFLPAQLAKQLVLQNEKLKLYQDANTPQGLDKRYFLPQNMLTVIQKKADLEVTAQFQEMSFDYSKKQGVKISSVRMFYFIKVK